MQSNIVGAIWTASWWLMNYSPNNIGWRVHNLLPVRMVTKVIYIHPLIYFNTPCFKLSIAKVSCIKKEAPRELMQFFFQIADGDEHAASWCHCATD
jgi:hypothetical protein